MKTAADIGRDLRGGIVPGVVVAAGHDDGSRAAGDDRRRNAYASPLELLLSPDGTRLYVLCQGADEVRVLNAATGAVVRTIPVGHVPRGFSFSPDGDGCL